MIVNPGNVLMFSVKFQEEDENLAVQIAAPPKPLNKLQNIRELANFAVTDLPRAKVSFFHLTDINRIQP
jgi:hypothetical protein